MNEPAPGSRLVVPGELLGTAEEYVPGRGTYENDGRIFAALLGRSRIDAASRAISVRALHEVPALNEGDLVLGRVSDLKSAMAIVELLAEYPSGRTVPGNPEGTIHVSKVKDGYTDSLADEFAAGDIVLSRVLQSRPGVKLGTVGPSLGVVSARCHQCHAVLELSRNGKELVCPRCGRHEHRKMAERYGGLPSPAPG